MRGREGVSLLSRSPQLGLDGNVPPPARWPSAREETHTRAGFGLRPSHAGEARLRGGNFFYLLSRRSDKPDTR